MRTERIRELLGKIENDLGCIDPAQVVSEVDNPVSELYELRPLFEWDDAKCGVKYRIIQAEQLIRRVKLRVVMEPDRKVVIPLYVHRPELSNEKPGYQRINVMQAPSHAELLIAEIGRAEGNLRRALSLAIALGLDSAVRELLASTQTLIGALRTRTVTGDEARVA